MHKGVRQVSHSGSTAGYAAHLVRFPDQHLSVAVLCNVNNAGATASANAVADLYLGDRLKPAVRAFSVSQDRVWDLRFTRQDAARTPSTGGR